jgi:hypothetical protein
LSQANPAGFFKGQINIFVTFSSRGWGCLFFSSLLYLCKIYIFTYNNINIIIIITYKEKIKIWDDIGELLRGTAGNTSHKTPQEKGMGEGV